MRKLGLILSVVGTGLFVLGIVTLMSFAAKPALAKDTQSNPNLRTPPEGATYVGSDTCFKCHSTEHRNWSNTLHSKIVQDAAANPKAVVADFSTGDDVRKGDGQAAYAQTDVTYTLGNKYHQRYIKKTDSGYQVLPGQWNVQTKAWEPAAAADWVKDCAGCHTTGFDASKGSWNEVSVACEACHGPGSVHVDAASKLTPQSSNDDIYAVRQKIVKTVDAAVCSQCHTRGTSADQAHTYPVGYVVGGPMDKSMFIPAVATGKEDDPIFWPNGTAKENHAQYNEWLASKHGNALADLVANPGAADYCLPCHSTDYNRQDYAFAQDQVTIKNAQFSITCVQCHSPHGEQGIENQLVAESFDLCISCHNATGPQGGATITAGSAVHHPMREMFEGVAFLGVGPSPSPHFANEANGPVCASCHMVKTVVSEESGAMPNHSWKVVLPTDAAKGQPDSCTGCHTLERDKDNTPENLTYAVQSVQQDTHDRVDALKADLQTIMDAHKDWDPKAKDKSEEQQLAERITTLVSFVESDGSWGFHNPSYTDQILTEAENNMSDLKDKLGM